jgi:hypothetical protein
MGRITPSFRTQFAQELHELEKNYVKGLRDIERRDAWDEIVEAWGNELGAMSISPIPYVLDAMQLTALLDNRKEVLRLKRELKELLRNAARAREMLGIERSGNRGVK